MSDIAVLRKIRSSSNPNKFYEIRLGKDGVIYCTCRGWINFKRCKHLVEYREEIKRQAGKGLPMDTGAVDPSPAAEQQTRSGTRKIDWDD